MADVFISYKREERQAVERLALDLRKLNLDVWFDASLNAGEAFSDEIDREAHGAKAILVCWSPTARDSQWVKSEALIGFEQRKLAACYVAGPDGFYPPTPFNSIHAEDLRAWVAAPSNTHAGFKSILRRIGALCGRADIESYGALDVQAPASVLRAWIERHQSSPLFMVVDALLSARDAEESDRARLEQEARERRAREEAERRAKEEEARRTREEQARREQEAAELARRSWDGEIDAALERARRASETASRTRRNMWAMVLGAAVVTAIVAGIWLSTQQSSPSTAAEHQEPAATAYEPAMTLSGGQGASDLSPGTAFRDCDACPDMVVIPDQSFATGRFEVTFADWDACVAAGGCNGYAPSDEGWGRGYRPVINVSWDDAQAYVQWLSQHTGQTYRLLTSAEWEIAARAGSTTEYSWGDESPVCDQSARNGANFSGCPYQRTTSRGSFQPNAFGLYDVHGNVWEWVEDCFDTDCAYRVYRGGAWGESPLNIRPTFRGQNIPSNRYGNIGFRIARALN